MIDNALATAQHSLCLVVSRSLNYISPGSLTFNMDMLLNITMITDLEALNVVGDNS